MGARRPRGWAGTEGTGTVKGGGDAGSERNSRREQKKRGARGTRGERLRETAQEAASVGVLSEDVWATGVFLTQPSGCLPLSRVDVPTLALPGRSHVGCHPCPASQATLLLARRTPVLLTSSASADAPSLTRPCRRQAPWVPTSGHTLSLLSFSGQQVLRPGLAIRLFTWEYDSREWENRRRRGEVSARGWSQPRAAGARSPGSV